ncbi:MAG: hypothetical protein ACLQJR_21400 [Stellaceae bacterium]
MRGCIFGLPVLDPRSAHAGQRLLNSGSSGSNGGELALYLGGGDLGVDLSTFMSSKPALVWCFSRSARSSTSRAWAPAAAAVAVRCRSSAVAGFINGIFIGVPL